MYGARCSDEAGAPLAPSIRRLPRMRVWTQRAMATSKVIPRLRCTWAANEVNIPYHDQEWGVPVHDEHKWFEFLILEGAQAGLSWDTILKKRARYREVFDEFDPAKVARYEIGRASCREGVSRGG